MARFLINGTDFGIDLSRSSCARTRRLLRGPTLTVKIEGDMSLFERLRQADGSSWAWALYPPSFSVRGLPVPKPVGGQPIELRLTPADIERHDVGLYFMEHLPVTGVVLRLGPGPAVLIGGDVEIFGEPGEFHVEWESGRSRAESGAGADWPHD